MYTCCSRGDALALSLRCPTCGLDGARSRDQDRLDEGDRTAGRGGGRVASLPRGPNMTPRLKLPTSGQKERGHQQLPSEDLSQKLGRRRRRPHRPVAFSTLAVLLVGLAVPVVDAFLGSQGQVTRLSALSRGGKNGLTTARSNVGFTSDRTGALSTGFTKRYYTRSAGENPNQCLTEGQRPWIVLFRLDILVCITAGLLWPRNACGSWWQRQRSSAGVSDAICTMNKITCSHADRKYSCIRAALLQTGEKG